VEEHPGLEVTPIALTIPMIWNYPPFRPRVAPSFFFPGSTIGNFEPEEAEVFLRRIRDFCGEEGGLLLGVDLKKDPAVLNPAYNTPRESRLTSI